MFITKSDSLVTKIVNVRLTPSLGPLCMHHHDNINGQFFQKKRTANFFKLRQQWNQQWYLFQALIFPPIIALEPWYLNHIVKQVKEVLSPSLKFQKHNQMAQHAHKQKNRKPSNKTHIGAPNPIKPTHKVASDVAWPNDIIKHSKLSNPIISWPNNHFTPGKSTHFCS